MDGLQQQLSADKTGSGKSSWSRNRGSVWIGATFTVLLFLTSFQSLDVSYCWRLRGHVARARICPLASILFELLLGLNAPCQVCRAGILHQNPGLIALLQHFVSRVRKWVWRESDSKIEKDSGRKIQSVHSQSQKPSLAVSKLKVKKKGRQRQYCRSKHAFLFFVCCNQIFGAKLLLSESPVKISHLDYLTHVAAWYWSE